MRRLEVSGQKKRLLLRQHDIVGKAAVAVDAYGIEIAAEIDPAGVTMLAAATGDVGIAGDPVADGKAQYGSPHRFDDAGKFMPRRHRWFAGELAVEQMPVGATDAAGLYAHQQVVRSG